jgi:hypothetical protein
MRLPPNTPYHMLRLYPRKVQPRQYYYWAIGEVEIGLSSIFVVLWLPKICIDKYQLLETSHKNCIYRGSNLELSQLGDLNYLTTHN